MKTLYLLAILILPTYALGQINRNDDFQLWLSQSNHIQFTDKLKWYLDGELRYGDSASRLYLFYLQTGFFYSFNKCFEIAPGYRHQYQLEPLERTWHLVYQPLLDLLCKFECKKWQFINRHRFSYLVRELVPNRFQYRNRLWVTSPWKIGIFNFIAFDEVFFREAVGFFENRFAVGGMAQLKKKNTMTIYYMLRHVELEAWTRFHTLFLQLNLLF